MLYIKDQTNQNIDSFYSYLIKNNLNNKIGNSALKKYINDDQFRKMNMDEFFEMKKYKWLYLLLRYQYLFLIAGFYLLINPDSNHFAWLLAIILNVFVDFIYIQIRNKFNLRYHPLFSLFDYIFCYIIAFTSFEFIPVTNCFELPILILMIGLFLILSYIKMKLLKKYFNQSYFDVGEIH